MPYNEFVTFTGFRADAERAAYLIEQLRILSENMSEKWVSYKDARTDAVVATELDARETDYTVTEAMVAEYGAMVGKVAEVVTAVDAVAAVDYNVDIWK